MNWLKSKKIVAVHSGNFHPDDVFSVALLSILNNNKIKVIRTREVEEYSKADFVVDIGFEYDPIRKKFDHHQKGGAGSRNEHINYSAFGLLWKEYGEKVCGSKKIADILDTKLVAVIDADDCGFEICKSVIDGICPFAVTDVIYSMVPDWKEDSLETDTFFLKAVVFAKNVILREIKITKDEIEAENIVTDIYNKSKDKRIIIFENGYFPRNSLSLHPEPMFAIYKERDGERWRVTTVRKSEYTYESRLNFPETWWGKDKNDLAQITGVKDAMFCRDGGVFAGAETKEGAIELARKALNN